MDDFWSSTDFAYMCLRDRRRTLTLRRAINQVVRPGDTVLDVGAGTGVLSLFAAAAGAARVFAVEADPTLAGMIRQTVAANGRDGQVAVLAGDVRVVDLPPVDVAIAELIETGLIEETLVPVLNSLYDRGVVTASTRVIPAGYRTRMQLVDIDLTAYGFVFPMFRHEWPFYRTGGPAGGPGDSGVAPAGGETDWLPVAVTDRSAPVEVWSGRLDAGPVADLVQRRVRVPVSRPGQEVNGVRITGEAILASGITLGACHTINGDKVLPLPPRQPVGPVELAVRYRMGAGLPGLSVQWNG